MKCFASRPVDLVRCHGAALSTCGGSSWDPEASWRKARGIVELGKHRGSLEFRVGGQLGADGGAVEATSGAPRALEGWLASTATAAPLIAARSGTAVVSLTVTNASVRCYRSFGKAAQRASKTEPTLGKACTGRGLLCAWIHVVVRCEDTARFKARRAQTRPNKKMAGKFISKNRNKDSSAHFAKKLLCIN